MAAHSGSASSLPSLHPPRPKSPPEYPDLYGKRRQMAKVQVLEREIGFLEEELKSVEGLDPASRCCKEVAEFVVAKSDPLMPLNRKNKKSCRFWKWLCGMPCFNFSWISWVCCCCYSGCLIHLKLPRCCDCNLCNCDPCACCSLPKCFRCSWPRSQCCKKITCRSDCCNCRFPSCSGFSGCPDSSCCSVSSCCPECSCCSVSSCCPDCSFCLDCSCCPDRSCCPRRSCCPDCSSCCPDCNSCCPDCSRCRDCSCCPDCSCCLECCCWQWKSSRWRWKCSCPDSSCCSVSSCCPECSCCPRSQCCKKITLCCSCKKTCCTCNPCCLFF